MATAVTLNRVFPNGSQCDTITASVAQSGTLSDAVDIGTYSRGIFFLPAEFNTDTITILVSNKTDGTFSTLYDDASATGYAFTAVGDTWNVIPSGAFGAGAIKIQTGTGASAAATITFCLKS